MNRLNPPYFLALDVDDVQQARRLVDKVAPHIGGIKLGPRLCFRYGAELIGEFAKTKPVFVDCKFFDIPNTMESSVRTAFAAGASFTTVHAQAGAEALKRLAQVEKELNQERPFKILAVTILTSFTQAGLPPNSQAMAMGEQVSQLATLALKSGLSGLVCSPEEVQMLRQQDKDAFLVVPGIRLEKVQGDDQARVSGPAQALRQGASALVIGRPILEAPDPAAAAELFQKACVL